MRNDQFSPFLPHFTNIRTCVGTELERMILRLDPVEIELNLIGNELGSCRNCCKFKHEFMVDLISNLPATNCCSCGNSILTGRSIS